MFFVCERCGAVGEAPGGRRGASLGASSPAAGFAPKSPVIEIAGVCSQLPLAMTRLAFFRGGRLFRREPQRVVTASELNEVRAAIAAIPPARRVRDRRNRRALPLLGLQQRRD
jgi:hypothetical protein